MWLNTIFGVPIGLVTYYLYKTVFTPKTKKSSLEFLKNALLTHALLKVKHEDIDNFNMNYKSFDGTKLPMISGFDLSNACSSYIITKDDLRNGPFYSRIMESKVDAIEKYLNLNLDTDEKVLRFFEKYIAL